MKKKEKKISIAEFDAMWIFAMFDLPVTSKEKMIAANHFRQYLLSRGFMRLQLSVYARFCGSRENACTYLRNIQQELPHEGQVRILMVTDKQFGGMVVFVGATSINPEKKPEQLLLF